jgi:hypothetical protein
MLPLSSVESERISIPGDAACRTVVVVTQPASAWSRNSTGFAPSLSPAVLLSGAVEILDDRAILSALDPAVARSEFEASETRVILQAGYGLVQGIEVEAVQLLH